MTEFESNVPIAQEAQGRNQRTPAAESKKRNNRNRRNNQADGSVSGGALINATDPPQRNHRQRQSVAVGATGQQQPPQHNSNMGNAHTQRQRPVSYAGNQTIATPAKEKMYAGPTFQASPAASALPMPKFSRSVPNAGARSSLSARLAAEKTPEVNTPSPEADVVKPNGFAADEGHKSPLDLFFKADQAEKERARASSQSFSPELATTPASMPRNPLNRPGRSIFLSELDGEDMPRPRTVSSTHSRPPFGDRAISSPGVSTRQSDSEQDRQTSTRALKDLLFQTAYNSKSSTPRNQSRAQSGQQTPDGPFGSPWPVPRSNSGPSTPQPSTEQQQEDHYSLHYGNRNLSPLFRASRSDTPPRPSSLRQEIASDVSSNTDSAVAFGDAHTQNSHAQDFPNQTTRMAGPAEPPTFPYHNDHTPFNSPVAQGVEARPAHTTSQPRAGGSRHIRSMEDDLRRMLKLNV